MVQPSPTDVQNQAHPVPLGQRFHPKCSKRFTPFNVPDTAKKIEVVSLIYLIPFKTYDNQQVLRLLTPLKSTVQNVTLRSP